MPNTTLDVSNVWVFIKGSRNILEITRVIRAERYTEMDMEEIRSAICGREKRITTHEITCEVYAICGDIREFVC